MRKLAKIFDSKHDRFCLKFPNNFSCIRVHTITTNLGAHFKPKLQNEFDFATTFGSRNVL
jgi:hypothetical protein